jgi:serine-type D-Ala-D-Ala carboxypeptidase/endopeptidase (penicillin-binding protein 4)
MQNYLSKCHRAVALCGWLSVQVAVVSPVRAQVPPPIVPTPTPAAICPSQLPTAIEAIIDRPELRRYRWGIVVQQLGSARPLYNRDGDRLFIPASNVKLITTAVALRQLGAATRLRTSVYRLPRNRDTNGYVNELLVVGRGDPSLTTVQLQSIAQQLKQRGERQIDRISFDERYFRGEQINGDWEWDDLFTDYAPAINSLMLGQNVTTLTISPQRLGMPLQYTWKNPRAYNWIVDNQTISVESTLENSVNASAIFGRPGLKLTGKLAITAQPIQLDLPVIDPNYTFMNEFRQNLNSAGISVAMMRTIAEQSILSLPEIAAIDSPPISELIKEVNLTSNNVYAEVLLKSIGRSHPQHLTRTDSTSALGIELSKQRLTELGVDPQAYYLRDGSGLSRHNLVAPMAFIRVLAAMASLPEAQIYRDSLPIAGVSGSLRNRLKGTIAQGIVRAKTGSMSGIISLSGYVNSPTYSPLVFSIILNQHDRSTSSMAKVIDEVVVVLARLKQCRS